MIDTLFFDVYGTLISTGNGSVNAAAKILKTAGSNMDPAAFYKRWKMLHKEHMQGAFQREEAIFVQDLSALFEEFGIVRNAAEDIAPMLDSLYGRIAFGDVADVWPHLLEHYRVIIASNTDTEPLLANLKVNGLNAEQIFTSESLRAYKPSPKFYEELLARTGVKPQEAVFIGDSLEEDVLAPQRMGMTGVLLDRKGMYKPGTGKKEPDLVIRALTELVKKL